MGRSLGISKRDAQIKDNFCIIWKLMIMPVHRFQLRYTCKLNCICRLQSSCLIFGNKTTEQNYIIGLYLVFILLVYLIKRNDKARAQIPISSKRIVGKTLGRTVQGNS